MTNLSDLGRRDVGRSVCAMVSGGNPGARRLSRDRFHVASSPRFAARDHDGERCQAPDGDSGRLGNGGGTDFLSTQLARESGLGLGRREGLGDRLRGVRAEARAGVHHHCPVGDLGVDEVARLVEVFRYAKGQHQFVRNVVSRDPFKLIEGVSVWCDLIDEAEAVASDLGHPDRTRKRRGGGAGDQADGVQCRRVGILGQRDRIPLWLKACCTLCRIVLSKLWICWAVGWPPKRFVTWVLLYQGEPPPVVMAAACGYGPLPTLMNA